MGEENRSHLEGETAHASGTASPLSNDGLAVTQSGPGESSPGGWHRGPLEGRLSAFFPTPLTLEKSTHLLSVIRAIMEEEGAGEPTSSGLDWTSGFGTYSVRIHNEAGGTRAQVTAGRGFGWSVAGLLGVVSGSVMAGILEPITVGVFVGSVAAGLGIALGVGTAYARGARRRVAMLMDRIHHTMRRMAAWPEESADSRKGSGAGGDARAAAASARDIERLDALLDRREAMGSRVLLRRLTYAIAVGASLVWILPIALRFFPTEYPLPWIVAGGLGWIFTRTVRRLFRGIRERKALDREIDTRLGSSHGPTGEHRPDVGSS